MKRIFFLYNNYEREHTNIELISRNIQTKDVQVFQGGITDKDIVSQLFRARPHIIFTFPITTYYQIDLYMAAKILFRSKIITFTTEGLGRFREPKIAKVFAGLYSYPPTLVDYHIYWGKYAAKYIGRELYKQGKLIGGHQTKVFGNPMYEKAYNVRSLESAVDDRKVNVLILTGFHTSIYTQKDLLNSQDVVNIQGKSKKEIMNNEIFKKFYDFALVEKVYCEKYIQHIIDAAHKHPDVLFTVKLHPQEILLKKHSPNKLQYLKKLENIENIQMIEDSIPIGSLLSHFQLLVHYGSTVDLEAYIYKVPTVKLEVKNVKNNFVPEANRLTESTYYVDIDESDAIAQFVAELKEGKNLFHENKLVEKQLYAYMNYQDEQSYKPSVQIADFLSGSLRFHKLDLNIMEKWRWIKKFYAKYM